MKRTTFAELRTMPEGTIFTYERDDQPDGLYVKGETWGMDIIETSLLPGDPWAGGEEAHPVFGDSQTSRHGMFNEQEVVYIYSDDDKRNLIRLIGGAVNALS